MREAFLSICCLCLLACGKRTVPQMTTSSTKDSVRAVRAAEKAIFAADSSEKGPLVVVEFTRDSEGAIVALSPAPKQGSLVLGGGARVRVFRNGQTKILEFFQ